jgi:hypothetical protein
MADNVQRVPHANQQETHSVALLTHVHRELSWSSRRSLVVGQMPVGTGAPGCLARKA